MQRNLESNVASSPLRLPTLAEINQRHAELIASLPASERHKHPPPPSQVLPQVPPPAPRPSTRPLLGDAPLQGLAGEIVTALAPHTEAHPAALLLQFLACFGNAVGRGPHCMVGATRHGLNLFVILVGDSSKARKGTSWSQIASLFARADPHWFSARVTSARLTAQGLVHALRDQQPPTDRRLLVLCEEFAGVLHALKRSAGQLSPMIRSAWDNGDLPTLDLGRPVEATQTHISLIAHITRGELAQNFPNVEARNGFANRCLWTWVQRTSCMPDPGSIAPDHLANLVRRLRRALEWTTERPDIEFRRSNQASELWQEVYPVLSQVHPGLRGAATSRAEAQVLRLSAIYAALDETSIVGLGHLESALAVWKYCAASAGLCFGLSVGDPIADRIREAVEASNEGLSRMKIRKLFHGHVETERIDAALKQLGEMGVLRCDQAPTRGRSANMWSWANQPEDEPEDESA